MLRPTLRQLVSAAGVAGAAAALALPAGAARPSDERQLQRSLDRLVASGVPGAVLLVRRGNRTVRLTSGYGDLRQKTPMRPGDLFRVGSITKAFVATVVLQLVAEQKLALDDTVERWLPGLLQDGRRITLRQLLGHRSGLFDYGGDDKFLAAAFGNPARRWAPRELVAIASAHRPYFPPGAGWAYSNTNYVVVGLIVEAATHRPLAGELARRIFVPLGLRATRFDDAYRMAGPHAHGYFLAPLLDVSDGRLSYVWAAGALVSNADDLARFFRALLGGRLVRADLLKAMETPVGRTSEFAYGLGLEKMPGPCGVLWGHTGGSPGYVADALNSKDGRRQVVVLVNATASLSRSTKHFRSFALPGRALPAYDRLVRAAYCG